MTNCATRFAYANEEECFAIVETSCGTLKKPTAGDRMYSTDPVAFKQAQNFEEDEQIRATASEFAPLKGVKNPGDWSLDSYVKPSGARGTPPEHDVLFQCLMGAGALVAGPPRSYRYTLANQLDAMSLWTKKGHTVFAFRGTAVEQAVFNVAGGELSKINWSGQYMEQLWAGTTVANDTCGAGSTVIQLNTGAAMLYVEGMYVEVGTDDNGGNGYLLTDVNYTNDTITIPSLNTNQGVNPTISPWWPTSSAEVGVPQHGKQGIVTIDNTPSVILSATVTLKNNIKFYIDEKNNVWTAERFGRPGKRMVTGNINHYFLERGATYFYKAEYEVSDALVIPVGNVAGFIMNINIPYARYETPEVSGDEEFEQPMDFKGIASAAGNDEINIVFA